MILPFMICLVGNEAISFEGKRGVRHKIWFTTTSSLSSWIIDPYFIFKLCWNVPNQKWTVWDLLKFKMATKFFPKSNFLVFEESDLRSTEHDVLVLIIKMIFIVSESTRASDSKYMIPGLSKWVPRGALETLQVQLICWDILRLVPARINLWTNRLKWFDLIWLTIFLSQLIRIWYSSRINGSHLCQGYSEFCQFLEM